MKLFKVAMVAFVGAIAMPAIGSAKVIVKKSTSYYTVTGKTGIDIARGLVKRGPKRTKLTHAIASTQWKFDFGKQKQVIKGRKCKIADIDITVTIKYTLPKWKPSKGASRELKSNWNAFNKLIIAHEHKHGAIAVQSTKSIEKAIKGFSGNVSKDCKDFGRNAERKFKSIARSYNRRHKAFDRREQFGLSKIARAQKKLIRTR